MLLCEAGESITGKTCLREVQHEDNLCFETDNWSLEREQKQNLGCMPLAQYFPTDAKANITAVCVMVTVLGGDQPYMEGG